MCNLLAEGFRRLFKSKRFYIVLICVVGIPAAITIFASIIKNDAKGVADLMLFFMTGSMTMFISITSGLFIMSSKIFKKKAAKWAIFALSILMFYVMIASMARLAWLGLGAMILTYIISFAIMLLYIPIIAKRIRNEEEVLESGLDGYADYKKRVKYRVIPFVW